MILTLGVVAAAVLAGLIPGAAALLEYDRAAVAGGELWRLLTGHLTHLSAEHLLWDALAFAVLAAACERRGRGRLAATLTVGALAIPAALFVLEPDLAVYRGLSGLDMALAGLLAATELRRGSRWAAAALPALGAKLAYELATGGVLFVALEGAEAVPLAHAAGAGVGVCAGFWRACPREGGNCIPTTEEYANGGYEVERTPYSLRGGPRHHRRSGAPLKG